MCEPLRTSDPDDGLVRGDDAASETVEQGKDREADSRVT